MPAAADKVLLTAVFAQTASLRQRVDRRGDVHRLLACRHLENHRRYQLDALGRRLDILADGTLQSQHDAMRRLLKLEPAGLGDMFDAEETLIELAVQRREERVAYQDERMVREGAKAMS